jgi:photosystem II stability/assembly factor-like uncharacterized protein
MRITILTAIVSIILFTGFRPRAKPEVVVLTSGTKTNLRGLSVVNQNVVWVSGSNGIVGKSVNGGRTWTWMTVTGFEKTDFRDIEAFDANTAVIMGISEPAYILKTVDGGDSWKVVYENKNKGMFLDAMDFVDNSRGIVVGDPINKKIFMAETKDGGDTWTEWSEHSKLVADSAEAFFAASGTNIRLFNENKIFLVSGGSRSRLFTMRGAYTIPMIEGKETAGTNSISVYDEGKLKGSKKMIVVGGDFASDTASAKNCFYSSDGGLTWDEPVEGPNGYRSSVEFVSKNDVLTCGLTGVDYSSDAGRNWHLISNQSLNTVRIAKIGPAIFLAGTKGTVAKIEWK